MPRPRLCRRLRFKPLVYYYKPQGVPLRKLEEVEINREELEAIKLKDYDKLSQEESAEKMKTSQSTFQRILTSARTKISKGIVEGAALKIEK
jgi:predicted DNA-binding protein (UPF0251 family)